MQCYSRSYDFVLLTLDGQQKMAFEEHYSGRSGPDITQLVSICVSASYCRDNINCLRKLAMSREPGFQDLSLSIASGN